MDNFSNKQDYFDFNGHIFDSNDVFNNYNMEAREDDFEF